LRVIATFPPERHPAIIDPFVLTRRADQPTCTPLHFITSPVAAETWRRHGFSTVG